MKLIKTVFWLLLAIASLYIATDYYFLCKGRSALKKRLAKALSINRSSISGFRARFHAYPVLKNQEFNFWDIRTNQAIWMESFENITNVASSPEAEKLRIGWQKYETESRQYRPLNKQEMISALYNPFTNQYDWIVEGYDGKLYSPDMPDSVLIASPPIRVANIRCPLTASDPPYYEDFTKW